MDSQTRLEHTVAVAALVQALVRKLATDWEAGTAQEQCPYEMLDENRWLAARHGLQGEIVDLPSTGRIATKALIGRLLDEVADHARDLGCADQLAGITDLLDRGNGAQRQVVVYEANRDLRELMAEIVAATGGVSRDADTPDLGH
jgi:carboxylate-amine ligase